VQILFTGASGFIAGYAIFELLSHGHQVVGVDNFSKYGRVRKSYDDNSNYTFVEGDVKNVGLLKELITDSDQVIAAAAMIGGINYFHEYAYDLLSENERIIAATFDAAIWALQQKRLQKINVLSSSMVFENAFEFPSKEADQLKIPPPNSTYGFQKLSTEYFAQGALQQYGLPYTIIRPFNCVGVGEQKATSGKAIMSGDIELAMSHVVPDLVQKILKGQDPLHILGDGTQTRHYTYGGDLAEGIRLCVENSVAINEDFNLSTSVSTSVLELAKLIWKKINGDKPFSYKSDQPFKYDVQRRVPNVEKAAKMLGFEAVTTLESCLDEIIPWVSTQIQLGNI
jgi:nucleoside-diphosphate-sugar epimerase